MADDAFTYEVEVDEWTPLMDELSGRQLRSAWRSGIRPSAKTIERGVLAQLDQKHPAASKYRDEVRIKMFSGGFGYAVKLSQGQLSMDFNKKGKLVATSHLYILRWLTGGTAERYTKRGARRGRIVGSHFFKQGVETTINPALFRLGEDITKSLQRAAARARAKKSAPQK
jgi:hypothetical protein